MTTRRLSFVSAAGLLLSILAGGSAAAQQCDNCSRPRIIVYDANLKVPRPSVPDSVPYWWTLQWPMVVLRSTLRNEDPTRDCVTWLDAGMVNARDYQGGVLLVGVEAFSLPPAGEVPSAEYLVTGSVSGAAGSFELEAQLETAVSREVVKTVKVPFGYDIGSQSAAGLSAAQAFMPVLATIRTFEVEKRNSDVTVAIRDLWAGDSPPDIKVTPGKARVNVGESVDVEIEMIDCDGVPLSNRTVYFAGTTMYEIPFPGSTGGTVEPTTVVTDGGGKATVRFTAGNTTGIGSIVAAYPHKKPCGRAAGFMGTGTVVIGLPSPSLWLVQATYSEEYEITEDTAWSSGGGSHKYHLFDRTDGTASMAGLIPNGGYDSTGFYFVGYEELGDVFENLAISGNSRRNHFSSNYWQAQGLSPDVQIMNETYSGMVRPGGTAFEFHYPVNPDEIAIVVQWSVRGDGSYVSRYTDPYPDYHWDEDSGPCSTEIGLSAAFNADECTITRNGMSYTVSASRTTEVLDHWDNDGTKITRTTGNLRATIRRDDSPDAIRESEQGLPLTYSLEQNYPNPFNPVTTIKYTVGVAGGKWQVAEDAGGEGRGTRVKLAVYDLLGREVALLVDQRKAPGNYEVSFDAGGLASGVYFYRVTAGTFTQSRKMLLVR